MTFQLTRNVIMKETKYVLLNGKIKNIQNKILSVEISIMKIRYIVLFVEYLTEKMTNIMNG